MIDRREILDTAGTLGLLLHVVEKDYVLGWVPTPPGHGDGRAGRHSRRGP